MELTGWVAGLTKRKMQQFLRIAYRTMGMFWLRWILPQHFTRKGAVEYEYEPRHGEPGKKPMGRRFSQTYTGKKLKTRGHTRPLLYSGHSKRSTRMGRAIATSRRVRIVMRAPNLNWIPPGWKHTMRDELTAVSQRDMGRLTHNFRDTLMRLIGGLKGKKTRVRR